MLSLVRDVNDTFLIASPMNHFGDLDFSEGSTVELDNCTGNRESRVLDWEIWLRQA